MAASSLTAHVTPLDAGAPIAAAGFLGQVPALALEDGTVLLATPGAGQRIAAHPGASILVAVAAGNKFITGCDDGRVVAVSADGGTSWVPAVLGEDAGRFAFRRWSLTLPTLKAGKVMILVKATNRAGESQPDEPIVNPGGYHNNAVQRAAITLA